MSWSRGSSEAFSRGRPSDGEGAERRAEDAVGLAAEAGLPACWTADRARDLVEDATPGAWPLDRL
jgi:hypothetical protein